MSKGNNLQSLFCGILFCISVIGINHSVFSLYKERWWKWGVLCK